MGLPVSWNTVKAKKKEHSEPLLVRESRDMSKTHEVRGGLSGPGTEDHVRHRPRARLKGSIKNPFTNSYNSTVKSQRTQLKDGQST